MTANRSLALLLVALALVAWGETAVGRVRPELRTAAAEEPAGEPTAEDEAAAEARKAATEKAEADLAKIAKGLSKMAPNAVAGTAMRLVRIWKDEQVDKEAKDPIPKLLRKIASSRDEVAARAGVNTLAQLGPEHATKTIVKVLDRTLKAKEPSKMVYKACLMSLGRLADPSKTAVKTLVDLLKYKDADVVNGAAMALAGYGNAEGSLRKHLFEEVVKQSEGVFSGSRKGDANQQRRWGVIRGGVLQALHRLSGTKQQDPEQARRWFNDHKKDREVWK